MVSDAEARQGSVRPVIAAAPAGAGSAKPVVLEVGFDQAVPWPEHIALSVQNMLVLAGLFLFPKLLGTAYHFSASQTAELYGATFVVVGFGTVLQGVLKLRMPIVLGPWSASLAGLLVLGKTYGLGTAFGSLTVAAAILTVLAIPVRGVSLVRSLASLFNTPALSGGIVLITGIGLEQIAVVNWAGQPGTVGFGPGNWIGGVVALAIVTVLFAFTRGFVRALAMILGIVVGSLVFTGFAPIRFTDVSHGPWFGVPSAFQFGFGINATCLLVFLILLIPPLLTATGFYSMVGEWGDEQISGERMAWGVFGMALSAVLAGVIGTFATAVYPENIGLLRSTRVGSRSVTITAGVLFVVAGFIFKVGALFAAVPSGVIGAAAVATFAVVMISGVEILAKVDWSPRNMMVVGLPTVLSVGGVFLAPAVYADYPILVRELITQPLVTGPILLLLLFLVNKAVPERIGQAR